MGPPAPLQIRRRIFGSSFAVWGGLAYITGCVFTARRGRLCWVPGTPLEPPSLGYRPRDALPDGITLEVLYSSRLGEVRDVDITSDLFSKLGEGPIHSLLLGGLRLRDALPGGPFFLPRSLVKVDACAVTQDPRGPDRPGDSFRY